MTNQSSELEDILDNFAKAIQTGDTILDVKEMETIPAIQNLIAQKVREARIDELERVRSLFSDSNQRGFHLWAKGRIKRLKNA